MRIFADFRQRAGGGADVTWIAEVAKAHADFTRGVAKCSTEAARRFLQP
jgi:hypothetical protein